jgi:hypothetical protein
MLLEKMENLIILVYIADKNITIEPLFKNYCIKRQGEIQGFLRPAQANVWVFSCVVSVTPAALNTV